MHFCVSRLTYRERAMARQTVELTADRPSALFDGLPVYEAIAYGVAETSVAGVSGDYATAVAGSADEGFTITNTSTATKPDPEEQKPDEPKDDNKQEDSEKENKQQDDDKQDESSGGAEKDARNGGTSRTTTGGGTTTSTTTTPTTRTTTSAAAGTVASRPGTTQSQNAATSASRLAQTGDTSATEAVLCLLFAGVALAVIGMRRRA